MPPYKGCKGGYADQRDIITATGGPTTPSKDVQSSQDAAATNARRGGSALRASKNRQNREAWCGVPSGSAAVVSEWDGRRQLVLRQQGTPSCGLETTRSLLAVTAAGSVVIPDKAPLHAGGKGDVLMGRPA